MGVEVLYLTQQQLAAQVSAAIATVTGLPNRGAKKRTDLYFLNNTHEPAILIEVCFVDSKVDADVYRKKFTEICGAVADVLGGPADEVEVPPEPPEETVPPEEAPDKALLLFQANHTGIICTVFGGAGDPNDSAYDGHRITRHRTRLRAARTSGGTSRRRAFRCATPTTARRCSSMWSTSDRGTRMTRPTFWATPGPRPRAGLIPPAGTTNLAGIDLTPGAAKAIGLDGKGNVVLGVRQNAHGRGRGVMVRRGRDRRSREGRWWCGHCDRHAADGSGSRCHEPVAAWLYVLRPIVFQ